MNALDTNIYLYAHDTRDPDKRQTALELIRTARPLGLLWQVGCEFVAASCRLDPQGFTPQMAWQSLDDMREMADVVLLPEPNVWTLAHQLQDLHSYHFWDAMIIAACLQQGIDTLYSEDLPGRQVTGLAIVNPF